MVVRLFKRTEFVGAFLEGTSFKVLSSYRGIRDLQKIVG